MFASLKLPLSSVTLLIREFGSIPIISTNAFTSVWPPIKNRLILALAAFCALLPPPIASAVPPTIVAVCPAIQPFQPALTAPSVSVVISPAPDIMPQFWAICSPASPIASVAGATIALATTFCTNPVLIGPPYITLFCTVSNTPPTDATM